MRLLALLPESPGPWANTPARYWAPMLREMDRDGVSVRVLAVAGESAAERDLSYFDGTRIRFSLFERPKARPFLERKTRSLIRPGWELAVSDFGEAARKECSGRYDAVLAETPSTARAVEAHTSTVLSLHYLQFLDLAPNGGSESLAERVSRIQSRRAELHACRRAGKLRVLSSRLRRLLAEHGVQRETSIVPLCVDPDLYETIVPPATPTVGVLGSMFWAPSRRAAITFLGEIAPRVRAAVKGVSFIVGGWRAREFLADHVKDSDVLLLDSFPAPRDAFTRLSVMVYMPPIGTGMKVKVLEAMAYGVPVVTNEDGCEGLDADPDAPVLRASSNEEAAELVVELLRDEARRRRIAREGRACVERTFSPKPVTKQLRDVLFAC
jgi:polysaccharide biosynthesis protein PslH